MSVLIKGKTKIKAVTNGLLLDKCSAENLKKFSAIGVSVNTKEEIDEVLNKLENWKKKTSNNLVMITNFGTHNVFSFEHLLETSRNFAVWQVQLTMGELQLPAEGIGFLREKIANKKRAGFKIVEADNLQECHDCMAGMRSFSITHRGNVIACLSERSYGDDGNVYGTLPRDNIKEIWENEFKDCRFECRKCCRDHITYPQIVKKEKNPAQDFLDEMQKVVEEQKIEPVQPIRISPMQPWKRMTPMLYGVAKPPQIVMYGVHYEPQITAYAVVTVDPTKTNIYTTDTIIPNVVEPYNSTSSSIRSEDIKKSVKKKKKDAPESSDLYEDKSINDYRSDFDPEDNRFLYGVVDVTDFDPQGNVWMDDKE
jgi:hypothetical protein